MEHSLLASRQSTQQEVPFQSVALLGRRSAESLDTGATCVEIAGQPIRFGLVTSLGASFEPEEPKFRQRALVRIDAFSCNYRDKSLLLSFAKVCREDSFLCFGSEFVGRVVKLGADVQGLQVGDRVMANGSYPNSGVPGVPGGLPTNHASKRLLAIPHARLIKVPDEMPDAIAASFQIGAQTSYSMLRKLALQPGERVLVTAARSNTSLFVLNALAQRGDIETYALTSSTDQVPWPATKKMLPTQRGSQLRDDSALVALCQEIGGFDAVVDPFFDLYAPQVLPFLRPGGRYVTCGCYRQSEQYAPDSREGDTLHKVLGMAMISNLTIIGNCIGETSDLERAIADHGQGRLDVTIDSLFRGAEIGPFLERTYNDPARFGKVVYSYS